MIGYALDCALSKRRWKSISQFLSVEEKQVLEDIGYLGAYGDWKFLMLLSDGVSDESYSMIVSKLFERLRSKNNDENL